MTGTTVRFPIAFAWTWAATGAADVAIAVVGDSLKVCGEWDDRSDLDLAGGQLALLRAVANATAKAGVPLVVVLIGGRPATFGAADGNAVLELTIVEGRNRQVRRLCKRAGLPLARLTRVSVGPVRLGGLAEGRARALTSAEVDACVELCMPPGTRRARLPL